MKNLVKRAIFYLILLTSPFFIWIALEFLAQQLSDRFKPLQANRKKNSLSLNQAYFNDYFLYRIPAFFTTSASNRAIHLQKNNRFRIFCLGESTTAGYPYNTFPHFKCPASFPNYLRAILQYNRAIPDLEILNAGCNAFNSFSVLQLFKDLIKYHPDVVIIYSGHNEFFGPNEFVIHREKAIFYQNQHLSFFTLKLRQTYLYQGLRWFIGLIFERSLPRPQDYLQWSKQNYVKADDPLNQIAKENFRKNIIELVRLAKKEGIKIVLCTPVSDWTFPPFISKHGHDLSTSESCQWDTLATKAKTLFAEKKYQQALDFCSSMKTIDSSYADLYYQSAKAYTGLAIYGNAAYELWRAKDLDAMPFRAKSFISPMIREIAISEDIILADVEQFFIQSSGKMLPNPAMFLEHVHPNDEGYYYIALHLAQVLVRNHVFEGVKKIEYPSSEKCRQALNIADYVVDKVEYDFANESYLARLSDLNPEIKRYLTRVRDRAYNHSIEIKNRLLNEMQEKEAQ